ncbi:MAG: hypothetical protein K2W96_07355 [Gemmataceae bacterium]|nr:hypothetical protein [Gemmataceae bacterium]
MFVVLMPGSSYALAFGEETVVWVSPTPVTPTVSLAYDSCEADENDGFAYIEVSLDYAMPDHSYSVSCATSDGTAFSPTDYAATSGTLAFAPGEAEATVWVDALAGTQAACASVLAQVQSAAGYAVSGAWLATVAVLKEPAAAKPAVQSAYFTSGKMGLVGGTVVAELTQRLFVQRPDNPLDGVRVRRSSSARRIGRFWGSEPCASPCGA